MPYDIKFITTKLQLGIEKPFSFLHISDSHVALADERDSERKIELAKNRTQYFDGALNVVASAKEYALKNNTFIVHTGDLIDFTSEMNYEYAKALTDSCDVFMASGNHEFSHYLGEAKEDAAYRNASLPRIQACFKNDIRFASRRVNGVNLIAIDNSYHQIDEEQIIKLKEEIKLGLPMLLFMHVPLYQKDYYDFMINKLGRDCAYLMNVPDELVDLYPESLHEHHRATKATREAYDLILSTPLIKALFVGHLHFDYEVNLTESLKQYTVGCATGRIIEIE